MQQTFYELWNAVFQESAAEERVQSDSIRVLKAWLMGLPVRLPGAAGPRPAIVDLITTLLVTCTGVSPLTVDGHPVTPGSIERIFGNRYFHDFLDRFVENPELLHVWSGILQISPPTVQQAWDLLLRAHLQSGKTLEPQHQVLAYDHKFVAGYVPSQEPMLTFAIASRRTSLFSHEIYYGPHLSESPAPMSDELELPSHHPEQRDESVIGDMGSPIPSAYGVMSSSAVEDSNRSTNLLESPIPRRPDKWQQQDFSRIIRPPTPFSRVRKDTEGASEDDASTVSAEEYELNAIPHDAPSLSARRSAGFYSAYSIPMVAHSDAIYSEPQSDVMIHGGPSTNNEPEVSNQQLHPRAPKSESSWDDSHFKTYQKGIINSSRSTTLSVNGRCTSLFSLGLDSSSLQSYFSIDL
ncbi:hypothetical protein BJ165DRAFT_1126041 [Panaeolus papilionaceus]|nr:hypothetical protein BJ165DRAFT_1126041 [Panaeolus papilionaceus]